LQSIFSICQRVRRIRGQGRAGVLRNALQEPKSFLHQEAPLSSGEHQQTLFVIYLFLFTLLLSLDLTIFLYRRRNMIAIRGSRRLASRCRSVTRFWKVRLFLDTLDVDSKVARGLGGVFSCTSTRITAHSLRLLALSTTIVLFFRHMLDAVPIHNNCI
jgi:hypothetical protein